MSCVHLVIVRDDNIYFVSIDRKAAKSLIEQGVESILPHLKSRYLDAGYFLVDLNRGVVVSGQEAFPPKNSELEIFRLQ